MATTHLTIDLSRQEPVPRAGVEAALALMGSGKLHRYGETGGVPSEVSALEAEFAQQLGTRYVVAMNSCGSTMFVALRAAGVGPGDAVLCNGFTLAPVPGAIVHAGARPVLVEVTEDCTIDLDDLARKAQASGARTLLLSHMRGHVCDMRRLTAVCAVYGVQLIEDCAHTMGAGWDGRATGTWGRAGCFSLQSYKHANSGEGGLLATDDDDIAAQAILLSGSYMFYGAHQVRPADAVFERWKYDTPNFSLRMSNLAAALAPVPHLRLPVRPPQEQFVASSIQFGLVGLSPVGRQAFVAGCAERGVHVKWFGAEEPVGFTSVWQHWRYLGPLQPLPQTERVLSGLCDMRLPLALTQADCGAIAQVMAESMAAACSLHASG